MFLVTFLCLDNFLFRYLSVGLMHFCYSQRKQNKKGLQNVVDVPVNLVILRFSVGYVSFVSLLNFAAALGE